jgi:formylglycine-generating enzyme required for sulfatase activity
VLNRQLFCRQAVSLVFASLSVWAYTDVSADSDVAGSQFIKDCDVCPELVRIEPGAFQMGTAEDEFNPPEVPPERVREERPAHLVQIDYPFAIGRHEVTIGEFAVFAEATDFEVEACFGLIGKAWEFIPTANWRDPGFEVTDAHPATCLSYENFAAYLQWLSTRTGQTYRFPTEAEWEFAARSGLGDEPAPSSLGPQACQHLNGADVQFALVFAEDWRPGLLDCDDGYAASSPVGSYQSNQLGMYDVFGNVSEWTEDCSGSTHEGAPADGSAHRFEPCAARVLKGGSWSGGPGYLRPAIRGGFPEILRGDGHGLRVVRELKD